MPTIDPKKITVFRTHPEVKGVSYGECISGWTPEPDVLAHSHSSASDPDHGWICFVTEDAIRDEQLCRHELAHILTAHGHDEVWRKKVLELGGHLEQYSFKLSDGSTYEVPCFKKECMESEEWKRINSRHSQLEREAKIHPLLHLMKMERMQRQAFQDIWDGKWDGKKESR